MASRGRGVALLERVDALLDNPALLRLAEAIPEQNTSKGGRPRQYPRLMWLLFEALISVYGSARQVEAELAHPLVWNRIREHVRRRFWDRPELRLPEQAMRRHHYLYARTRYLTDPEVFARLAQLHREIAAAQALELGLLDPDGPGSWKRPDPSRLLYADGKVLTPLFRAKPDELKIDRRSGAIRVPRHEPDAGLHWEGDGEPAWGTKFVLVAVRTEDVQGRVVLDVEWVPSPGNEAAIALDCFTRLAPLLPGAQGVVYDTALRGVHHQHLMRDLGWLSINRVTAAVAGKKQPRRAQGQRVEKKHPRRRQNRRARRRHDDNDPALRPGWRRGNR